MEVLAYTHSYESYEEAVGIDCDLDLRELNLNWFKIPNTAWLGLLGCAVFLGSLSVMAPAFAALETGIKVKTSGGCLTARKGPSDTSAAVVCVSNGAVLKPVVATNGNWLQLSSGNWVYGPYTTSTLVNSGGGGGGSPTLESGIKVKTPNGGCLRALTGPGTGQVVACVRSGSALKPVVAKNGNWLQLSSGNWVYGPYTTSKFF